MVDYMNGYIIWYVFFVDFFIVIIEKERKFLIDCFLMMILYLINKLNGEVFGGCFVKINYLWN